VSGTGSTHGRGEKCIQNFGWKTWKNPSEDLGVDGRIVFRMDGMEIGWEGVEWIHVAQDRGRWRALGNTVMNPQVR